MKKIIKTLRIIAFALILASLLFACAAPRAAETVFLNEDSANGYRIGGRGPGGGIIFYHDADGFIMSDTGETAYYLEASPANLSRFVWASPGATNREVPGTETAIGTGRKNTAIILVIDPGASAALTAKNFSTTVDGITFSDWFLPSRDELFQLYINRAIVGITSSQEFWSSSQSNFWDVFALDFGFGEQVTGVKNDPGVVCPIRAF